MAAIETRLALTRQTLELSIDPADGAGLSWLYRHSEVLDKHMRDDGRLAVTVRADADNVARVRAKFAASAESAAQLLPLLRSSRASAALKDEAASWFETLACATLLSTR